MRNRVVPNPDGLFLVGRGVQHTHAEIARKLGITRQRVMEIERNALRKIRKALEEQGVKSVGDML